MSVTQPLTPKLIADERCVCGEGPLWHEAEQRLYWVDIEGGKLFRYNPADDSHELVLQPGVIGGFTIQADGALLLFLDHCAIKRLYRGELSTVVEEIPAERDSRFNDVIADPEGRVYCGVMPTGDRLGRLYRLERDGSYTLVVENLDVPNGMGFTADLSRMFYTSSNDRTIFVADYDRASGRLSNHRVFVKTPEDGSVPDGMAVDADDNVWSARWDGRALYRYDTAGKLVQAITFPAKKVSSVTFGGPDYTDAYVSTAGGDDKENEGAGAGALFRLDLGVRGKPPFLSRIGL